MYNFSYSFFEIFYLVIAYLCGSTPFGLLIAKKIKNVDIRKHGSGNIGATNVARVLGLNWAVVTFLLDGLKGFLPVILAKSLFQMEFGDPIVVLTGICAILGHIFPVWLRFKGGKGVSTTIFVLTAVDWRLGLFFCIVWLNIFLFTKISALSALGATLATTLLSSFYSTFAIMLMCVFLCVIITIRHKSNIQRILNKKELNFKDKK